MEATIEPQLLRWARERSGVGSEKLYAKFPKLGAWENGDEYPTLKEIKDFAKTTHAPIGYLFLPSPPVERVPLPDFRVRRDAGIRRPSPELLEMAYVCEQRQEWYRDYARVNGVGTYQFVGTATLSDDPEAVAKEMTRALGFSIEERRDCRTWEEALRKFIDQADEMGVMVMCSGVVMNNTHRRLDPKEFCGFTLSDEIAPLIFVNGADTKAAQMFTLAHELAHVWLGKSALSDSTPDSEPGDGTEKWCNSVAAELLVPLKRIREEFRRFVPVNEDANRLARQFKVSTLVILRRMLDAKYLSRDEFDAAYRAEIKVIEGKAISARERKQPGGRFFLTLATRVGKRFARALVESTLEGQTLYRDAFHMLGITKAATLHEFGHRLRPGL